MARPHYWWNITDLKGSGFVEALQNAGPNAVLRFHEDTKLFTIDDPDAPAVERDEAVTAESHDGDGGFNFSHKCPPDCG